MTEITVVRPKFEILTPLHHIAEFQTLLEIAGRTCYQSQNLITADSSNGFIKKIIANKHHSVLEHCVIMVKINCSRSCSHQLVRHRIGSSYSQSSQRFINHQKKGYAVICPPSIGPLPAGIYIKNEIPRWVLKRECKDQVLPMPYIFPPHGEISIVDLVDVLGIKEPYTKTMIISNWLDTIEKCYDVYCELLDNKVLPEDARSVLPNATQTEIVTTFNLRQWRHVFEERALNPHAQWEIKEIMMNILIEFNKLLPAVFGDLFKNNICIV
jgi:thymidylate synthase (FAD)